MGKLIRQEPAYRSCPTCLRPVEIVDGKWSQHTNPKTWGKGATLKQCSMAGRAALEDGSGR